MVKYYKTVVLIFSLFLMLNGDVFASRVPEYNLKIKLHPEKGLLEGHAKIFLPANVKAGLLTVKIQVKEVKINGKVEKTNSDYIKKLGAIKGDRTLEIRFSKIIGHGRKSGQKGKGADLSEIVLLSNWYPVIGLISKYNLAVELPDEYEAVSEADSVETVKKGALKILKFKLNHPTPCITLVAGKYKINEEKYKGISIKTYFFSRDDKLSSSYIEKTKRYIDMYVLMLGKYPYGSFSVVENKYQTGYSFPTYTLLGSRVLRLPFIIDTSLGHEILHQWFGNYVYVNHEKGNWCEGLTTYLADHRYKENKGKGWEYRKKILINYSNYVNKNNTIPLKNFTQRTGYSSRSIGYGKAAMVFHMLRKKLGDEKFFGGLKNFIKNNKLKKAGWNNLKESFNNTGKELDGFFTPWLERDGLISFNVSKTSVIFRNGRYILKFKITQSGGLYDFQLPLKVFTEKGIEKLKISVDKKENYFTLEFKTKPVKLLFDDEYDLMRKLTPSEKPSVMSSIIGDKTSIVITPEVERDVYDYSVQSFKKKGYVIKDEKDITNKEIKANSIILLSVKNKIYKRLFAGKGFQGAGSAFRVMKNPLNIKKNAMVIDAKNADQLKAAFNRIFHYGNYSLLMFDNGRIIKKETDETERGIFINPGINIEAIETKNNLDIDRVIEKIKNKRIVYVGESHTVYAHHLVQYEIIKRLFNVKGKLVIGMEMFQEPFQKYLDQFISGEIDETDFLKKSEYFKRWRYNYNLYRDILHFARSNKIPVRALNIKGEIVRKVSKNGIDSLSPEEYSMIPQNIDMTNAEYRMRLQKVLLRHSGKLKLNIENFFQSQILWDETMAHNTAKALKKYPGITMVVLAGNGHLENSWGIPDRVGRLSGVSHAVILNGRESSINESSADFVLIPSGASAPASPRIMVFLKTKEGRLHINKIIKNGPADKAGLKKGDVILSVDGIEIKDISDLKILLLNKKKGDIIEVKVRRKKIIIMEEEIVKKVTL